MTLFCHYISDDQKVTNVVSCIAHSSIAVYYKINILVLYELFPTFVEILSFFFQMIRNH